MPPATPFSAVIIAKDEEERIAGRAATAWRFCDEVLVLDGGSTDRTRELAERRGRARPGQRALARLRGPAEPGVGPRAARLGAGGGRRRARDAGAARRDRGAAARRVRPTRATASRGSPTTWAASSARPTGIPTRSSASTTAGAGAGRAHSCTSRCSVDGSVGRLRGDLEHYTYRDVSHHMQTIDRYTTLWAEQAFAQGQRAGAWSRRSSPRAGPSSATTCCRRGFLLGARRPHRLDPERVLHVREAGQADRAGPHDGRARMRVLHVDSAAGWRGGQNQVLLTAQGMAARGHEVVLACRRGGALEARAREAGPRRAGDAVPRRPVARRRPGDWPALLREVRAATWCSSTIRTRCPPACWRARPAPARAARGHAARGLPPAGPRSRAAKYRAAARVIAVSRAIARRPGADGIARAGVRVVYEGVPDRAAARPGAARRCARWACPDGALVVGNVAALTDHKDHATLLDAAARVVRARLPAARFVIVGDGELRAPLEARARALGLRRPLRVRRLPRPTSTGSSPPSTSSACRRTWRGSAPACSTPWRSRGRWWRRRAGGIPEAVADGVTGRVVPARDPDGAGRRARGPAGRRRPRARPGRRRTRALPRALHRRPHGGRDARRLRGGRMRVRAILNPRAGLRPRARRSRRCARAGRPGAPLDIALTQGPGDATRLAREAAERGRRRRARRGRRRHRQRGRRRAARHRAPRSASCPMGSGNGLARTLGRPAASAGGAAIALESAVVRRMDVGRVERPPLPERGRRRASTRRWATTSTRHGRRGGRRGVFTYVRLSAAARVLLRAGRPGRCARATTRFEGRALVIAFVNGRQYGGGGDALARRAAGRRLARGRGDRGRARLGAAARRAAALPGRARALPAAIRLLPGDRSGARRPAPRSRTTATASPSRRSSRLEVALEPRGARGARPAPTADDPRSAAAPFAPGEAWPRLRPPLGPVEQRRAARRALRRLTGSSGARTGPPRKPARSMAAFRPATPCVAVTATARGAIASCSRRARAWSPSANAR